MFLDEILDYLETQGLGTVAVDLFGGGLPDTPHVATGFIETPGIPPINTHDIFGINIQRPSLQVIGRAAPRDYNAARTRVYDVINALLAIVNQPLDGVNYLWTEAIQSAPFLLEIDTQDRYVFACNFNFAKGNS